LQPLSGKITGRFSAHNFLDKEFCPAQSPNRDIRQAAKFAANLLFGLMKWLYLALIGLAQVVASSGLSAESATNSASLRFKYERFTAENGDLYKSPGYATNYDNDVFALLVDSSNRVWVGSPAGLSVYDGRQWTNRTFRSAAPFGVRLALGLLTGVTSCGPYYFAEGPSGTVWLGGVCVLTRFRDGRYEEIRSGTAIAGFHVMAVDRDGKLWVVDKLRVLRYDGQTWSTVLCPYIGKPRSYEAPGLRGIAIETNGHVWIGGTAYGELQEPWEHEGAIWVVDQEHKKQGDGPPMAPLFEFDGKSWKAFGPQQGPNAFYKGKEERPMGGTPRGWASPQLDEHERVMVNTPTGYYIRDGDVWKPAREPDALANNRWVLRKPNQGHLNSYSELVFRNGESLVEVRPTDHRTGEVLDLGSYQLASLKIAEDSARGCVWLGTWHGLYRIWPESQ
jgi:hypothetical protein